MLHTGISTVARTGKDGRSEVAAPSQEKERHGRGMLRLEQEEGQRREKGGEEGVEWSDR
jgi:hypothetical protein